VKELLSTETLFKLVNTIFNNLQQLDMGFLLGVF